MGHRRVVEVLDSVMLHIVVSKTFLLAVVVHEGVGENNEAEQRLLDVHLKVGLGLAAHRAGIGLEGGKEHVAEHGDLVAENCHEQCAVVLAVPYDGGEAAPVLVRDAVLPEVGLGLLAHHADVVLEGGEERVAVYDEVEHAVLVKVGGGAFEQGDLVSVDTHEQCAVALVGLHDGGETHPVLMRDVVMTEVVLGLAAHYAGVGLEGGEEHVAVDKEVEHAVHLEAGGGAPEHGDLVAADVHEQHTVALVVLHDGG